MCPFNMSETIPGEELGQEQHDHGLVLMQSIECILREENGHLRQDLGDDDNGDADENNLEQ
jgi:hypothetical protein